MALWDLVGKIAGLPIHALMGTCRTEIGAYASSQLLPDVAAYVEQAKQHKAEGWAAYKIHPPTDPDTDIKVCEAVRRAVGDAYPVMLDSTWSYDYVELRLLQRVEGGPCHPGAGLQVVRGPAGRRGHPVVGETAAEAERPHPRHRVSGGGLDTYPIRIRAQATDYLRGDIPAKGGLLKTAHLAEAYHMNYEVHHSGNSRNNLANLHLCMAIPNTTWFEVLLPDGAHRYGLEVELWLEWRSFWGNRRWNSSTTSTACWATTSSAR